MKSIVFVPNRLINASYKTSILGKRLLQLCQTEMLPINYVFGLCEISISVEQWLETHSCSGQPYRDLKHAADALSKIAVRFPGERSSMLMCDRVMYEQGEGKVQITFSQQFMRGCIQSDFNRTNF